MRTSRFGVESHGGVDEARRSVHPPLLRRGLDPRALRPAAACRGRPRLRARRLRGAAGARDRHSLRRDPRVPGSPGGGAPREARRRRDRGRGRPRPRGRHAGAGTRLRRLGSRRRVLRGANALPPRHRGAGAHQRRRRHPGRSGAGRPGPHHRPHQPVRPEPARRTERRAARPALPRSPGRLRPRARRAARGLRAPAGSLPGDRRLRLHGGAELRDPGGGPDAADAGRGPGGHVHRFRGHRGPPPGDPGLRPVGGEQQGGGVEERLGSLLAAFLGEMAGIRRPGP
jgi:hypothetical protein